MTILYVETNFLMSIVTGRDPNAEGLLSDPLPSVRILMPSVCILEALSTLEVHRKQIGKFKQSLTQHADEFSRDLTSAGSRALSSSLRQNAFAVAGQFEKLEARLLRAVVAVSARAEMIELLPSVVAASVARRVIADDLTDNLILHSICHHAGLDADVEKVLLSGNTRDFGKDDVKQFLRDSGVSKYFTESQPLLNWAARPSPDQGDSASPAEGTDQTDVTPE